MCLLISLMVWSTPELRAEEPVGKVEALKCVVQVERNGQKQSVKIGEPVILTPNMISHVTGDNPPLPPRFITPAERNDHMQQIQIQLPGRQQLSTTDQENTSLQPVKSGQDTTAPSILTPTTTTTTAPTTTAKPAPTAATTTTTPTTFTLPGPPPPPP